MTPLPLPAEAELVIPHVSCHKATHINQLEVGNMSVARAEGGECQRERETERSRGGASHVWALTNALCIALATTTITATKTTITTTTTLGKLTQRLT